LLSASDGITLRSVGRRLSFAWCLEWNDTWVVARLIGRSCTWTHTGRWKVAWITARMVGWRLSLLGVLDGITVGLLLG